VWQPRLDQRTQRLGHRRSRRRCHRSDPASQASIGTVTAGGAYPDTWLIRGVCDDGRVDLVRLGARLRAIRIARGERLVDVARRSGLSASAVSRNERGKARRSTIETLDRHAGALEASLELNLRWRGADPDKLINAAHSALHELIARLFTRLTGWVALPEVSFSIYGERGVIDWLAWHPATRSLLVIELKTTLIDVQAVLTAIDRYARLASRIARDRGWQPSTVSVWLAFEDSTRNRRAVATHRQVFAAVLPRDGRDIRRWLRQPEGSIRALSFLAISHGVTTRRTTRRVSARSTRHASVESTPSGGRSRVIAPQRSPREKTVEARASPDVA
jgi:transcriptional regulator with XRE-family HTH domain